MFQHYVSLKAIGQDWDMMSEMASFESGHLTDPNSPSEYVRSNDSSPNARISPSESDDKESDDEGSELMLFSIDDIVSPAEPDLVCHEVFDAPLTPAEMRIAYLRNTLGQSQ